VRRERLDHLVGEVEVGDDRLTLGLALKTRSPGWNVAGARCGETPW
jgi:hypothetical protein